MQIIVEKIKTCLHQAVAPGKCVGQKEFAGMQRETSDFGGKLFVMIYLSGKQIDHIHSAGL